MQVRDAMSKAVVTVGPDHTLRQAAQLMSTRRTGSAIVVDPDSEGVGIITERDILNAIGSGLDPDTERVTTPAARPPHACRAVRRAPVPRNRARGARRLSGKTAEQLISFARGAPSLDIIDIDGLKAAAARAFESDPAGITAYGTSVGYPPLRKWIADKH